MFIYVKCIRNIIHSLSAMFHIVDATSEASVAQQVTWHSNCHQIIVVGIMWNNEIDLSNISRSS